MRIEVELFAGARAAVGESRVSVEVPEGCTSEDLIAALGEGFESLKPLLPSCRLAVEMEYVQRTHVIEEGMSVALIPPVSGG